MIYIIGVSYAFTRLQIQNKDVLLFIVPYARKKGTFKIITFRDELGEPYLFYCGKADRNSSSISLTWRNKVQKNVRCTFSLYTQKNLPSHGNKSKRGLSASVCFYICAPTPPQVFMMFLPSRCEVGLRR